jgi:hypothetical protein
VNENRRGGQSKNSFRQKGGRQEQKQDNKRKFEKPQSSGKNVNFALFGEKPKLPPRKSNWRPPVLPKEPIPVPTCSICGNPIKDLSSSIADRISGEIAHFDCVKAKIESNEVLGQDETVSYIGGGRFGVLGKSENSYFTIKKIIEWESTETRAEWRNKLADRFSTT